MTISTYTERSLDQELTTWALGENGQIYSGLLLSRTLLSQAGAQCSPLQYNCSYSHPDGLNICILKEKAVVSPFPPMNLK